MNGATDKWDLFISGDEESFTWLYENHTQFLYEYGMRFTPDAHLVKDCIHDLFLKLYKNRKAVVTPRNVRVYLLVALKHTLFNALNHSSRIRSHEPGNRESVCFSFTSSVEDDYVERENAETDRKRVDSILSVLSPRQREIIYYRYLQEFSMEEICLLMNISYQSAQNLIQKALNKIKSSRAG